MNLPTRFEIASIAAQLMREGKSAADACRDAIRLLEAASFAEGAMKAGDGFTEEGIDSYESRERAHNARVGWEKSLPQLTWSNDVLPWDQFFNKCLKPHKPRTERLPRFRHWLMNDGVMDNQQAAQRIGEYKRDGVPKNIVSAYLLTFDAWWNSAKRVQCSQAAKLGQNAKQARRKNAPKQK